MTTMILNWLATEFNVPESSVELAPLAGDASSRRYYRCYLRGRQQSQQQSQQYIVMQQPKSDSNQKLMPTDLEPDTDSIRAQHYLKFIPRGLPRVQGHVVPQGEKRSSPLGSPRGVHTPCVRNQLIQGSSSSCYSEGTTELHSFVKIAKQLQVWGLRSPEIHKADYSRGLLLLTDFGDQLYLSALNQQTADGLYTKAMDALFTMQQQNAHDLATELQLPHMGDEYIADRLMVFKTWFLQRHLQQDIQQWMQLDEQMLTLNKLFSAVYAEQPQVFVHLDYHSRNLLVLPDNSLGIIDFQDAMIGPITYDLVSLLQDAYITWPRQRVEQWVADYQQRSSACGVNNERDFSKFMRWFDLVGVHRHLKNLGVFARLYHRDGKAQYLQSMPTLISYIVDTCRRYPELAALQRFFVDGKVT